MRPFRPSVAGAVIGLSWYFSLGGRHAIDPTNLSWLVGDHAQHVLGWLFFRNEPWGFPIGRIDGLMYPIGTTVGFTDANPWVSVILKPFSPWLPVDFQFIGPWLALCFMLQGAFGAKIMEAITPHVAQRLLGAALFVLAPTMLQRLGHDTLAAHWLLLAAIWLHLRPDASRTHTLVWIVALNVIAAGVHPYLALMVIPLTFALLYRMSRTGELSYAEAGIIAAGVLAQTAAVFWLFGYLGAPETLEEGGFGFFSADILTFFNSMGYSRWLPAFRAGAGQYEGFAFLGSGVLGLAIVVAAVARATREWPRLSPRMRPLLVASILLGVFALSSHIAIAGYVVLTVRTFYDPLAPIVEPIRASGRFIWPLYYVVLTGVLSIVVGARLVRPVIATTLLVAAVAVQAAEVQHTGRFADQTKARAESPVWDALSSTYRHLVLYPAYYAVRPLVCQSSSFDYATIVELSELAYRKKLTFNSAYVARTSTAELADYCVQLSVDIGLGRFEPDTVYIVDPTTIDLFTARADELTCGTLDGFHVCVSNAVASPFRRQLAGEVEPIP